MAYIFQDECLGSCEHGGFNVECPVNAAAQINTVAQALLLLKPLLLLRPPLLKPLLLLLLNSTPPPNQIRLPPLRLIPFPKLGELCKQQPLGGVQGSRRW